MAEPRPNQSERARKILQRQTELEAERAPYEPIWEQVANFCNPDAPNIHWSAGNNWENQAARSDRRAALVYDNTIGSAANRLTAGLESLIIPQSEKWHGISTAAINDEETDEEKEWGESLRDFLFEGVRYVAGSNFVPGTQAVLRNVVYYGPGYLYAEEGFGSNLIYYCSIPVQEGYIARNRWGVTDIFHRRYARTIREIAQVVGFENLPLKIRNLANDPEKCWQKMELLQAIEPRDERKMYNRDGEWVYLDKPFASYHILAEEEEIVQEKGFSSFPVSCFNWRRYEGDTYGISPTIEALTTVKEMNEIRRVILRRLQQQTDPPTATPAKYDDIPVLNPNTNYPGLLNENGQLLVQPIMTGGEIKSAFEYVAQRGEEVRDMLFVNLFQILVQNPEMTATEALIRQEEKGSLLGPSGSIIQSGFGANLDRELAILEDKGIYASDSRFVPPPSLSGKDIRPTFTSPLDILRRAAEARDTMQVVSFAGQYAQATQDPAILDNIDGDEALKVVRGAGRAPQRVLRRKEEVEGIRQSRAQAQQAQQGMAAMAAAAKSAKDAVPAAVQARDSGLLQNLAPQGNA